MRDSSRAGFTVKRFPCRKALLEQYFSGWKRKHESCGEKMWGENFQSSIFIEL